MFELLIVGCGKMGRAILDGIIKVGQVDIADIAVFDTDTSAIASLLTEYPGVTVVDHIADAQVVVVATKPNSVASVSQSIDFSNDPLVISIAAGIATYDIEKAVQPRKVRVVRAMPNTPGQIGLGITALCAGEFATKHDLESATRLLGGLGDVVAVPEYQMDAITAISGSGPAYLFMYIEAMIDSAIELGLSRELSAQLVTKTVLGSTQLLIENNYDTMSMRLAVSSPGGTTIAGTNSLERTGFRASINSAVRAAFERSRTIKA